MDSKIKSNRLLLAIILPIFLCSCDYGYDIEYYLFNQTEDTIQFKWFKRTAMIPSDSAKQQPLYDTVYVIPPDNKILMYSHFMLGGNDLNEIDWEFDNQLKVTSCFGPILFKDGNSIQYSRNCTYPKNFYNAHSTYIPVNRNGETALIYFYYVTEEDYQQALEGKQGNSDY